MLIKLKLIRVETSDQGTFGVLLINGIAFCVTLELPWRDNQNDISCIPEGIYPVERYLSPKHGAVLLVKNVPGRDLVEIHPGNLISEILGCILVGQYWDKLRNERAVLNSGRTFARLLALVGGMENGVPIQLEVVSCL